MATLQAIQFLFLYSLFPCNCVGSGGCGGVSQGVLCANLFAFCILHLNVAFVIVVGTLLAKHLCCVLNYVACSCCSCCSCCLCCVGVGVVAAAAQVAYATHLLPMALLGFQVS